MKRLPLWSALVLVLATVFNLWPGGVAHATDYTQTRLMDDTVFNNVGSLNASQVADFLAARPGPFTKLASPSTCLSGYSSQNFYWDGTKWHYGSDSDWNTAWGAAQVPASTIIAQAAQNWGINPEVIIATLEKEESLIAGSSCDGWRYNSAMGYGCPDSGGCNPKYAGFTKQVLWGAYQLEFGEQRAYGNVHWDGDETIKYYGYMTQGVRARCGAVGGACSSADTQGVYYDGYASIDGQSTLMENGATASLYTYTPHLGNSTPVYFEQWFGPAVVALAKVSGQPQIYFIFGNTRLLIPDPALLNTYNLGGTLVSTVSQSYLNSLTDGGNLTSLAKKDNGSPNIYMLDSGKQYLVPSGQVCTDWGLDCSNSNIVKTLPASLIESLPYQGSLKPMFANRGLIYKPEAGQKRPVLNQRTLDSLGGYANVIGVQDLNANQPVGTLVLTNSTLLKFASNPNIYWYDQDALHIVSSPELYTAWAFYNQYLEQVPASYMNGLSAGADFTNFGNDGNNVPYLVDQGVKYSLAGHTSDWPVGTAVSFGQSQLGTLPNGVLKPILHSPGGAIFSVYNNMRYIFPSFDDFYGLGNNPGQVGNVSASVEPALTYGGFHLTSGRVFKIAGSDDLFVISDGSRLRLSSLDYIGRYDLPADRAITVDTTTANRYPLGGTLQPLFVSSGDNIVYLSTGQRLRLTPPMLNAYGVSTNGLPVLNGAIVNRMPQGPDLTQFAKSPSTGALYSVSGGQRHYIDSLDKLKALGGTGSNVLTLPDDFLNTVPMGSPA